MEVSFQCLGFPDLSLLQLGISPTLLPQVVELIPCLEMAMGNQHPGVIDDQNRPVLFAARLSGFFLRQGQGLYAVGAFSLLSS